MPTAIPLEAAYYIRPEPFSTDKEKIFYRSWQCVCHVSEVASPGSYATHQIADEKVFVVCDGDGQLRAFYNLCRHRGHPLLEGRGRARGAIVCPYHAWRYDFAGTLQRAPGACLETLFSDQGGADSIALQPVRFEIFCGFVFVNLDDKAQPLAQQAAGLEAIMRSYHPDLSALRFVCETEIVHDCNWKISVENYNECYHCPTVHGSSLTKGVLSMDGYTTEPQGWMIWHEGKAQTTQEKQYDYDTARGPRGGDYGAYWIWPNVSFCCYPGGYFTIRQWLPINWRKTIYRYRWFSDGSLPDADVEALMEKHRCTTGAEDEAVVAKVQQGMESRAFTPGPYVMGDGRGAMSEVGLQHFHRLYRQALEA